MRRAWILLMAFLLVACAGPSPVTPRPPVPVPVPDHGPPSENPLVRVMISWDIYVKNPDTNQEEAKGTDTPILLLTCKLGGNARVRDAAGQYVFFPWGNTLKLPYDFVIYVDKGAVILLRCTGTLLQVQPAWRFECVSYVDQTVVDRNSDVVTADKLVRSISCVANAAG